MIPGLGAPWGLPPHALHAHPDWFPEWTEPPIWAGGPLPATQNAEPATVPAFELHILLEVVYAVVGGIPRRTFLDGAIFIPGGVDENTTEGDSPGPVLLQEIVVHLSNGKEFRTQND